MATEKLRSNKSPGIDQIPSELLQAEGKILRSEIHKLINFMLKRRNYHSNVKKSITVTCNKNVRKLTVKNYSEVPILWTTYKILSNIFPPQV
jgi:hypothetical protein